MLPLSDFTIKFSQSKDYIRSAFLLHLLAMVVLARSGLPLMMKFFLGSLLVFLYIHITRDQSPITSYQKLSYHPGGWILHGGKDKGIKYERVYIIFEGGVFILLQLSGINPRKTLVIFNDQMTINQYRTLKFLD